MISVASWEPRFELGLERSLERYRPRRLVLYHYHGYAARTADARARIVERARNLEIDVSDCALRFSDRRASWSRLKEDLYEARPTGERALLDITTMPRETIWSSLFWLEAARADVRFVYHRPDTYGDEWLARDPDQPRFVYKLAGAPVIGKKTALLMVTGYDRERAVQAIEFYEPAQVVLAFQVGTQFKNSERNLNLHGGGVFDQSRVERLEVDSYSADQGYAQLRGVVERLSQEFNIVLASFGPKPSAIALYRLQRAFDSCALAYIHCKDYSNDYSTGLGDSLEGSVLFSKVNAEEAGC